MVETFRCGRQCLGRNRYDVLKNSLAAVLVLTICFSGSFSLKSSKGRSFQRRSVLLKVSGNQNRFDSESYHQGSLHFPRKKSAIGTDSAGHLAVNPGKRGLDSRNFDARIKRPEDEDELNRRRTGGMAKFNQSSPYEVRLHYNESLDFYRRARQVRPVVQLYLSCVNDTAALYERTGRITSKATMKLVGQDITLKCNDW